MRRWGSILAAGLLLCSCTRVVDGARPVAERPVAPITAGQVEDLLSKQATPDTSPDLFATVQPAGCAAVAQEVNAPLIFDPKPAAHSGGEWDDEGLYSAGIVEVVGVYHADFDSGAELAAARGVIESCEDDDVKVTAQEGEKLDFRLRRGPDSGSPQIVLWSLTEPGNWACDNAFVAAHNAAVEITTCAETNGYPVLSLARDALTRIETLANATS